MGGRGRFFLSTVISSPLPSAEFGLISPLLRLRDGGSHRFISSCSFAWSAPPFRNVNPALRASETPWVP